MPVDGTADRQHSRRLSSWREPRRAALWATS